MVQEILVRVQQVPWVSNRQPIPFRAHHPEVSLFGKRLDRRSDLDLAPLRRRRVTQHVEHRRRELVHPNVSEIGKDLLRLLHQPNYPVALAHFVDAVKAWVGHYLGQRGLFSRRHPLEVPRLPQVVAVHRKEGLVDVRRALQNGVPGAELLFLHHVGNGHLLELVPDVHPNHLVPVAHDDRHPIHDPLQRAQLPLDDGLVGDGQQRLRTRQRQRIRAGGFARRHDHGFHRALPSGCMPRIIGIAIPFRQVPFDAIPILVHDPCPILGLLQTGTRPRCSHPEASIYLSAISAIS